MKIATHNVLFLFGEGTHQHSGQEWYYTPELVEARISHFAKVFSELDADILFLQEVASEDVIRRIVERAGIQYSWFLAEPDRFGVRNAVLYKGEMETFSVLATTNLPVFLEGDQDTLSPRVFSRRGFAGIKTSYNGKPLLMLGLHFKAGFLVAEKDSEGQDKPMSDQLSAADGLIRSEFFRFAQARAARQTIEGFLTENPDGQVVVAGDFNDREGGVLHRIVQGVSREGENTLVNATDTLPEEERVSFEGRKLVDHVMLSQNIASSIRSVRVFNQGNREPKDIAPHPKAVRSDHPPVLVELQ